MNALWHYWHPVSWSKEVADKPVPIKLLDQPLVIWRANDKLAAFYDLCLHRGAALSLGLTRSACPCLPWLALRGRRPLHAHPSLPPDREIPNKARAKAFRVQERYGLVWVCLDEPFQAVPDFPSEFGYPSFNWAPYTSEASGAPTLRA